MSQAIVIEINPPAPLAGQGCFNYYSERELLENGPFEFRIVNDVPLDQRGNLFLITIKISNSYSLS
jgi:hypothetical protein